jgi:uncharacterized protein DUF2752
VVAVAPAPVAGVDPRARWVLAAVRASGLVLAALLLARVHMTGRPATLCPWRALTGLPCPFCGGTTAAVDVGHLDALGALRANPLVVVGAGTFVVGPVVGPLVRLGTRLTPRAGLAVAATVLAAAEAWQLVRFGFLS